MTVEHEQWGPNGLAVEQIVRRASQLSADEVRRLASAWAAWTAPDPAESPADEDDMPWLLANDRWTNAEDTFDEAVAAAGRGRAVNASGRAARQAVLDAGTRSAAPVRGLPRAADAASTAALAAAAVDLAGIGGSFTIDHLNMLLAPWRAVVELVGEPVCECGP